MSFWGRAKQLASAGVGLGGFYLAVLVIAWPMMLLIPREWTGGIAGLGATSVPTVLAAIAVNALLVRIGATRWRTVGWRGLRHGVRWFAWGASFGLAMALSTLVLAVLAGDARLEVTPDPVVRYLGAAGRVGLVLCLAALAEELLFRGYPLARLARPLGKVGASVALGMLFVALHTGNPNVTTLGLANIGLASLVLSAAFFTPGGLPVAWGVHFGWNGGLGLGADAPVSGLSFGLPLLDFTAGGPHWLTGGSFGPEGGLVATAVMAVALVLLARRARLRGAEKNVTQETEQA